MNQVFQELETSPKLKHRVKIIGIGAGNSDFEVNFFRKTYDIQFPLFSDGDFVLHQTLDAKRFLEKILAKSGLSPAMMNDGEPQ